MSKPWALYNEIDEFAAAWLEQLIAGGHIAPGVVDRRSIEDLRPDDLRGFRQVHLFAGIGVWSYSLRRAGVPDDAAIWSASCPCQPFSAAGKGEGMDDERHLWPHVHHLVRECRPPRIVGEQVASKDGLAWLGLVQADMEGTGYAFGALDTCAASFGAPHIRQRLYWFGERGVGLADACGPRLEGQDARTMGNECAPAERSGGIGWMADASINGNRQHSGKLSGHEGQYEIGPTHRDHAPVDRRATSGMADAPGRSIRNEWEQPSRQHGFQPQDGSAMWEDSGGAQSCANSGLADAHEQGSRGRRVQGPGESLDPSVRPSRERSEGLCEAGAPSPTNGFWRDVDWLFCRDGKWRPVEPGTQPLAHGAPCRVGRLRGYGNAINAEQAVGFIQAILEKDIIEIDAHSGPVGDVRLNELSVSTNDMDLFG